MHLRGSLVDEALTVEGVEHGLTLTGIQRARRRRPRSPRSRRLPPSIHGRARDAFKASHAAAVPIVGLAAAMACITRSRRPRTVSGGSPGARQLFFMKGDDRLRPLQAALEPGVCPLPGRPSPALTSSHARIPGRRLPATLLRRQAVLALPAPRHQMRRVKPFASQQGPELAGTRTRVRFPQDLELVGGRESSADVAGHHLGVGRCDRARPRDRPWETRPLRGASLRSSPLRSGSPPGDWSTPILQIMSIKILTPPHPQH